MKISLAYRAILSKDVNRRADTMDFGDFVALENEVKTQFHTYNKGVFRIFQRAKARSSV